LWDPLVDPESPEYSPTFVETRARESRFFDSLGVDNVITMYGFDHGYGEFSWRMLKHVLFGEGSLSGWYYSVEDLERMGVNNIILPDGEWAWQEYWPRDVSRVWLMSLDDGYELKRGRFSNPPVDSGRGRTSIRGRMRGAAFR
jgi:hypothetical protein